MCFGARIPRQKAPPIIAPNAAGRFAMATCRDLDRMGGGRPCFPASRPPQTPYGGPPSLQWGRIEILLTLQ